jgi:riboflavin kinase/FMN adenylyltransferase
MNGGVVIDAARERGVVHQEDRWTATGLVVPGAQRGRAIGFPTANLRLYGPTALPRDGVYAGLVRSLDDPAWWKAAAISVGTNPTFDGRERTVEVHLLDFDGDLYGRHLHVRSVRRLRGMVRYTDVESLIEAIAGDVMATRRLVNTPAWDRDGPIDRRPGRNGQPSGK